MKPVLKFLPFVFKVFIECVTILLLSYVLVVWPRGIGDLNSLIKDQTHIPCIGRQSLNHWTTKEVPKISYVYFVLLEFQLTHFL